MSFMHMSDGYISLAGSQPGQKRLQFSDKDEHLYFWFPLLAGLSELTFDPRPDLRCSLLLLQGRCPVDFPQCKSILQHHDQQGLQPAMQQARCVCQLT